MSTELKILKKQLMIFNRIAENIIREMSAKSIIAQVINNKVLDVEFKIKQLENKL
jgi:hypothetical protein